MTPEEHPKNRVAIAILNARDELNQALEALEALPVGEGSYVRLVAHTLQTYLTVAAGSLFLLEHGLAAAPPGAVGREVTDALAVLKHTTQRMGTAALWLATGASDAPAPWTWEAVDAARGLERLVAYYQSLAAPKAITIALEVPPVALPPVWADRVAAAAILENLLSNAVKFSPPGGRVVVRLRRDGDTAVVTVADEGPGLSPEDQARLFQRGVRLTPKPTAGEPSSGYGLAVAKDLAARLGGQLWCDSVLGQGCAFSLRLPLAGPPGGPPQA
jgi:two-component system, sensor histidine kinase and response regulator